MTLWWYSVSTLHNQPMSQTEAGTDISCQVLAVVLLPAVEERLHRCHRPAGSTQWPPPDQPAPPPPQRNWTDSLCSELLPIDADCDWNTEVLKSALNTKHNTGKVSVTVVQVFYTTTGDWSLTQMAFKAKQKPYLLLILHTSRWNTWTTFNPPD